ncbi:MAG: [Fe-Fe] hydrogenase large subunit C-terminal domain-containing protein [Clostridia bacterium]
MNVVTTIKGKCKGCYACVRNCPVKAIKVEDGQAAVIEDLCIACGYCVRVCAQHAKYIKGDLPTVREALRSGAAYAMLAPSFVVEFAGELRPGQVVEALRRAGFAGVYEVAWGAERVTQEYIRLIEQEGLRGVISTPCPAVVNLVEARFPELLHRLARVVSPMVAAGRMIKRMRPGACTVFIGPCVAKKSEVADAEVADAVDAVLTFAELRSLLDSLPVELEELPDAPFDQPGAYLGRLYPVAGGLLRSAAFRADILENDIITVEGKDNCIEFLEALRRGRECPEFVDMLFCEGCINGPMITSPLLGYGRRRVAVDFARKAEGEPAGKTAANAAGAAITASHPPFPEIEARRSFRPRSVPLPTPTEDDIRRILRELDKTRPEDELNCGACGYNTCREKAVAVFQGLAENKMCLPYLIKQLEVHNRQLADLKAYHEDIIQSITEGIVVVDRNMIVTSFNDAGGRVSRQAPKGAIGRKIFDVLPALDTPACRHAFEQAIRRGVPTEIGEVTYLLGRGGRGGGDGKDTRDAGGTRDARDKVIVNLKVSPLKNASGDVYGAVLLSDDITERRRLETQLIQSDRLAALGQLAAGVAHEINTPLTLISGYTEILAGIMAPGSPGASYLKTIAEEADRIAEIVRSLLSFARPASTPSGKCGVNEAVERTLKIFGGQMAHKGVEVKLELDGTDPEAAVDAGELQQVLLNMVLNAIQAMPDGGLLAISTRMRERAIDDGPGAGRPGATGNGHAIVVRGSRRGAGAGHAAPSGRERAVEIVIADTGCGIPEENLGRIFDPFFTTKEVGKGTGLGLSVSFGIVEKHGGSIRVESEVGKGTTFTITLPAYAREA